MKKFFIVYRGIWIALIVLIVFALQEYFLFSAQFIFIAALFAFLSSLILFRGPAEIDFKNAIVPLLSVYEDYFHALTNRLYQKNTEQEIEMIRVKVENAFRTAPEWVLQKGYHARLREGHRHFLIRVIQIGEILFSLHALTRQSLDKKTLKKIKKNLYFIADQVGLLFFSLAEAIELRKPKGGVEDWDAAIDEIENILRVEDKKYIYFVGWVENMKDLRYFLLKCVQAMR